MSGWRVTTSASFSGPSPTVTTSGTRTPACAAISVATRFVLDLLESTHGRAARRITVREEPPAARQPLRVLSVSTEHADLDRAPVRGRLRRTQPSRSAAVRRSSDRPRRRRARRARRAPAPSVARRPQSRARVAPARPRPGRARRRPEPETAGRCRASRHRDLLRRRARKTAPARAEQAPGLPPRRSPPRRQGGTRGSPNWRTHAPRPETTPCRRCDRGLSRRRQRPRPRGEGRGRVSTGDGRGRRRRSGVRTRARERKQRARSSAPTQDTDASASEISASTSGADRATAAAKPVTTDARSRNVASIVRRFRLFGSGAVSNARFHEALPGSGRHDRCAVGRDMRTASRMTRHRVHLGNPQSEAERPGRFSVSAARPSLSVIASVGL